MAIRAIDQCHRKVSSKGYPKVKRNTVSGSIAVFQTVAEGTLLSKGPGSQTTTQPGEQFWEPERWHYAWVDYDEPVTIQNL